MSIVSISYSDLEALASEEMIGNFVQKVLAHLGKTDWELSLVFASDAAIQELNREYRHKDEPTDVLSFLQGEYYHSEAGEKYFLAGDIIISPEALARNCSNFAVSAEEELKRLIIHGILHLSGLDHATNESTEPMLIEQEGLMLVFKDERINYP